MQGAKNFLACYTHSIGFEPQSEILAVQLNNGYKIINRIGKVSLLNLYCFW